MNNVAPQYQRLGLWGIGVGILFPLFFQIDGGIYRKAALVTDSQGVLATLPLPLSTVTCLTALILWAGSLRRAQPAIAMILGVIAVSAVSLWLANDGITPPERKLIMTLQVTLPLMGLLLGQMVDAQSKLIARAFLVVLSVVVPLQLLATKLQGGHILTHYLYAFSIYSHRQFVTLIFVCAFAYSLTSLWDEYRLWLCLLMLPMLVYVTRSYAFLTIAAYGILMIAFAAWRLWANQENTKWLRMTMMLLAATILGALLYFGEQRGGGTSDLFLGKFSEVRQGKIPSNVQERFNDWKNFGNAIVESKTTLLAGHPEPMPREIRTSPHNWYIDIVYNFGLLGLIPILVLMSYTVTLCWRRRMSLQAETWWLAAIVFYLVIIDSNFKVTLRQPYPGIFAYFMWGLLLSRLRTSTTESPVA